MVDTHSHIYVEDFEQDLDDVVQRALQVGVDKIFLPNINEESIAPMFALAERYPNTCYPMIGLHPEDVKENWQPVLERMAPYLSKVIAVGEAGLDFYWDATYKKEQIEALRKQLETEIKKFAKDIKEKYIEVLILLILEFYSFLMKVCMLN